MGTATSSDGKELYVSTGRGNTVAIIDTAKNAVATTIPVGNRAWGIALDPSGSKLYTANGASNDVSVVDLKSRKEIASDQSRRWPLGHCSCNRRKIISSTRGRHNPPVAKRGVIHRRDSDIAPATRAIGDPLPWCCLLADMPARLCPVRGE